jgi:transposase
MRQIAKAGAMLLADTVMVERLEVLIPTAPGSDAWGIPSRLAIGFPGRSRFGRERGMGQAVGLTNREHWAAELRRIAARHKDAEVVRRLLALALVLDGKSRSDAARQNGMDRQPLCDWVHRYNAAGVAGLASRVAPGPTRRLDETQMAELEALVLEGPDPAADGVVRWRCADLREQVKRRFAITVHERTIGKWLRRRKLTRLQPRPAHPCQDLAAQEAFKQILPS